MPDVPSLSRLDLNLLISLDALLSEKSVTRAAERLHLSQPSLSASLSRLRIHFGDQLLARRGNSYDLTPLARRLAEHTATAIDAARRVFEMQTAWDPRTSSREFSIFGSDYGFATIGRLVARLAADEAPDVRFRFLLHNQAIVEDAGQRLRAADGMVLPHGYLHGLRHTDLWRDDWLVVAAADNPVATRGMTMSDLATMPWVFTYQTRSAFTPASRQLQELGVEPHVVAVVESFLALPHFIAGTDRLGLIQRGLAHAVDSHAAVVLLEPPFEATPVLNALWWDPIHESDPEHAWLRELFARAGRMLGAGD